MPKPVLIGIGIVLLTIWHVGAHGAELLGPEDVLRVLVQANIDRDLATMARFMAQDSEMVAYTIGGRKYVGWPEFAQEMRSEFASVSRLEIPISELKVWRRGDIAWFAMELDYIRYAQGETYQRAVFPLRETGVLERRNGAWVLVTWHESFRDGDGLQVLLKAETAESSTAAGPVTERPDLSGQWEIQEEDKSYTATLDREGNGTYSWQGGRISTVGLSERRWEGTWHQSGNDREGGFEVLLSEDGREAKGVWWYTRVGDRRNIPPRQWGGSYIWKRLGSSALPPQ
jgi:hypothetical protein